MILCPPWDELHPVITSRGHILHINIISRLKCEHFLITFGTQKYFREVQRTLKIHGELQEGTK